MSAQTPTEESPARPARADGTSGASRVLGLVAVCVGVVALAAATFVLSYAGIRAVVLQAGIQPRYARGYPLLIDAMLVIVLAALLYLRGAGLPSRTLAWLTLLVVLAAAAGADTLHATGRTMTHNAAAITGAVLPWALVLLAFLLLLTMLRHARLRHQGAVRSRAALRTAQPRQPVSPQQATLPLRADQPSVGAPDLSRLELSQPEVSQAGVSQAGVSQPEVSEPEVSQVSPAPALPVRTPQHWNSAGIVPGFSRHLAASAAAGAAAADMDAAPESDDPAGDPSSHEAFFEPDSGTGWAEGGADAVEETLPAEPTAETDSTALAADTVLAEDSEPAEAVRAGFVADGANLEPDHADPDPPVATAGGDEIQTGPDPDQTDAEPGGDGEDIGMPVFHRMWSSPTPPES
jgi:Protein of unknown function (DUF2637)